MRQLWRRKHNDNPKWVWGDIPHFQIGSNTCCQLLLKGVSIGILSWHEQALAMIQFHQPISGWFITRVMYGSIDQRTTMPNDYLKKQCNVQSLLMNQNLSSLTTKSLTSLHMFRSHLALVGKLGWFPKCDGSFWAARAKKKVECSRTQVKQPNRIGSLKTHG